MKPVLPPIPSWLHAAALLVWGIAIGQPVLGAACALLRLIASRITLQLSDADLARVADLTSLVTAALFVGLLVAAGLPRGLLLAAAWMPAVMLPLTLVSTLNASPLRLRHLAVTLRKSVLPDAQHVVELGAIHLLTCLLAAGVAAKPSPWIVGVAVLLLLAWLGKTGPRPGGAFLVAALFAAGLALVGSSGIHRAHLLVQNWVIDNLAGGEDFDPYRRQTRIGELGELKASPRILWRLLPATPSSPAPRLPLLLRQGVFHRYADGTWLAQADTFRAIAEPDPMTPDLRLRGSSRDGRSLLPAPAGTAALRSPGLIERNSAGIFRIDWAPSRIDAELQLGEPPATADAGPADLSLPARHTPLLPRLPELEALAGRTAAERVAGLEAWFAGHFSYSLFLGDDPGQRRDLDAFLLRDRSGHCEYFATATVLLLRELGIPARYVSGFSVQDYSTLERAWLIRQSHAHAWAEARVDGRWVEVDTTPGDWAAIENEAAPVWRSISDVASWARLRIEDGFRTSEFRQPAAALALAAIIALAGLAWRRRSRRSGLAASSTPNPPSAAQQEFSALETEFAGLGLPRAPAETPRQWLSRIGREGASMVSAARLAAANDVVAALYWDRYS